MAQEAGRRLAELLRDRQRFRRPEPGLAERLLPIDLGGATDVTRHAGCAHSVVDALVAQVAVERVGADVDGGAVRLGAVFDHRDAVRAGEVHEGGYVDGPAGDDGSDDSCLLVSAG